MGMLDACLVQYDEELYGGHIYDLFVEYGTGLRARIVLICFCIGLVYGGFDFVLRIPKQYICLILGLTCNI